MSVTLFISQLDTSAAKFDALKNIVSMVVTLDVSQLDTSEAKFDV